jgi:hypothetical protein
MMLRPFVSSHDQASSASPKIAIPARFSSVTAAVGSSNSLAPVTARWAGFVDVDVDGRDDVEADGAAERDEEAEAPVGDGAEAAADVEATWTRWSFPRWPSR